MSEFEPITSQEQLDGILKDRLARKDAQYEKQIAELKEQFSDYEALRSKSSAHDEEVATLKAKLDEANGLLANHDALIAEKEALISTQAKDLVKTKIAIEMGLYDAISYIQGDSEDEIRKSAEGLKSLFGATNKVPMPSESIGNGEDAAYKSMLANLS